MKKYGLFMLLAVLILVSMPVIAMSYGVSTDVFNESVFSEIKIEIEGEVVGLPKTAYLFYGDQSADEIEIDYSIYSIQSEVFSYNYNSDVVESCLISDSFNTMQISNTNSIDTAVEKDLPINIFCWGGFLLFAECT